MFIVSNGKIWIIGKGRQREGLRKDFSAASMLRFELAKRKSTDAITGCFRLIKGGLGVLIKWANRICEGTRHENTRFGLVCGKTGRP